MTGILAQLPRPQILPRAAELLARFQLTDAGDRPVRTYSGGMRRRLDIAASLVQRPPVLFLDEPTTGLDITSRNELWDMIRELVEEGTTVLLTTQYLEEADRLANRIAVVDNGHVIANDTPENLKAQLGSTVVEMGLGDDVRAQRAVEAVTGVFEGKVERDGSLVRVSSDQGAHALIEVLRSLDGAELEPETLTVREPSMDDVFLNLTGRHAEEQAEAEAAAGGNRIAEAIEVLHELHRHHHHDRRRARPSHPARAAARHVRAHAAQPDRLPARAATAGVLHDPAHHLRADVHVRVRRRHRHPALAVQLRRLPDAGHLRADRGVRRPSPRRSGSPPT